MPMPRAALLALDFGDLAFRDGNHHMRRLAAFPADRLDITANLFAHAHSPAADPHR
jgi:hypothetical protein